MNKNLPRAIRNNNWLNIRYNVHNQWKGLAVNPNDGSFCIFVKPEYGLRAAFKLILEAYFNVLFPKKQWTIEGIISRWAPASENNVSSYINDVMIYLHDRGFLRIENLSYANGAGATLHSYDRLTARVELPFQTNNDAFYCYLVAAMAHHEIGDTITDDMLSTIASAYASTYPTHITLRKLRNAMHLE